MRFRSTGALATLVGAMKPGPEHVTSDVDQRTLADRLRDQTFVAEFERLHAQMVEQLAPAAEGPIVNPGRRRHSRLVFGDANE